MTVRDVWLARERIGPFVRSSPLVVSPLLSEGPGTAIHLKLESLQETGSFKIRGAANRMLVMPEEQRRRGVVAFSTGNHGRAVAYMANRLGIRGVVCLSERVPEHRVEAIRRLGAEVAVVGDSQDEAEVYAHRLRDEQGMTMIHPFDDRHIIAGQGTIGLELLHDLPEIDTVVVPVSGGGLISGIALVLKEADPRVRVVGVSMERAPVMFKSLEAGHPIQMPEEATLADALAGGIGLDNEHTFAMVRELVDEMVTVSEPEIAEAIVYALQTHALVVEGAGAVGIAAVRSGKAGDLGQHAAIVVSGRNLEPRTLFRVARDVSEEAGGTGVGID